MVTDYDLKNPLTITNTALFYICMTTASASKQYIILAGKLRKYPSKVPIFTLSHQL